MNIANSKQFGDFYSLDMNTSNIKYIINHYLNFKNKDNKNIYILSKGSLNSNGIIDLTNIKKEIIFFGYVYWEKSKNQMILNIKYLNNKTAIVKKGA